MPDPSAPAAQARLPDHRPVRRRRPAARATSRRCEIIELGEQLGFDSAWVRHRHLQYGISSPVAVLAAASQRTSRIELGTAVIPLGWENPLRLAEDLATVDLLSGGRLNPGVSVGPPMRWDDVQGRALPGHRRRSRTSATSGSSGCCGWSAARRSAAFSGTVGIEVFSDRVAAALARPGRPALVRRRQPPLGPVGRRARDELPDQQRRQGRGVRGLRRDPALAHPARSASTTPTARRPASRRVSSSSRPTRASRDQRAKYAAYAESRLAADRHAAGSGADDVRPRPGRHVGRRSPSSSTRTPASARSTRSPSRCRSPSSTTTTSRSSPTSRPGSARRSAGDRRHEE